MSNPIGLRTDIRPKKDLFGRLSVTKSFQVLATVMRTYGVFHPKVYLFKNTKNDWCVLTGSSNFTSGGFDVNEEVNVLFTQDENVDGKLLAQTEKYIEAQYLMACDMTMRITAVVTTIRSRIGRVL